MDLAFGRVRFGRMVGVGSMLVVLSGHYALGLDLSVGRYGCDGRYGLT